MNCRSLLGVHATRELQRGAGERFILWLHASSATEDDHQRRLHECRLDGERRLVSKRGHKQLLYQRKAYRGSF